MSRERVVTFRGEDHTITVDREGNWSIYRGGDSDEIPHEALTEEEFTWINDYVYDWRAGN